LSVNSGERIKHSRKCPHDDKDTARYSLTFSIGNNEFVNYELCEYCKQHQIFSKNLVKEEKIESQTFSQPNEYNNPDDESKESGIVC